MKHIYTQEQQKYYNNSKVMSMYYRNLEKIYIIKYEVNLLSIIHMAIRHNLIKSLSIWRNSTQVWQLVLIKFNISL